MILSYAIAVNSIAVAKVQQIFGIHKFFDEKIKKAAPKDGYTLHITHYTLHITHYTYTLHITHYTLHIHIYTFIHLYIHTFIHLYTIHHTLFTLMNSLR